MYFLVLDLTHNYDSSGIWQTFIEEEELFNTY